MNFADTNWLEAMFFESAEAEKKFRRTTAERFHRHHASVIGLSHVVYLEARNIFGRVSGEADPAEWRQFQSELLHGRFYLDPMNWDILRRETFELFAKYAHKTAVGTLDMALVASARLTGGTRLLSFDQTAKAVAVAEGMEVFPELNAEGKALLAKLRR